MPFQLYTVNHLTHPLSEVSKAADFAHHHEDLWRRTPGVHSLVTLSTCNRVEVYISADPDVQLLPHRREEPELYCGAYCGEIPFVNGDTNADANAGGNAGTNGAAGVTALATPTPGVGFVGCAEGCSADAGYGPAGPAKGAETCQSGRCPQLQWNYLEGREVAEHLYRVAAGLDSMVVGEAEVAGQVRRAFTRAQTIGSVNGLMVRMFEGALATSRRVSSETSLTGLGRSVVSVALDEVAAAAQSAQLEFWGGLRAVLLGTGAYAGATVMQLRARGVASISTLDTSCRAEAFARNHATKLIPFEDLVPAIAQADLVVGCRGVGEQILTAPVITQALELRRERGGHPLTLVDLALHRDVDPVVRELDGVVLFDLEDIRHRVPALAVSQIQQAHEIIEAGLRDYDGAVAARHMDPAIVHLRQIFTAAAEAEIAALPAGATIPREAAEKAIQRVVAKLAHTPTVSAHMAAESGLGKQWVDAVATVWGLTPEVLEDAFSK